jgi:mannose-1-phosphate guanylyltransferase
MYRVRHFREKPNQAMADELYRTGALWNTFVFAGRAAAVAFLRKNRAESPVTRHRPKE